MSSLEEPSYKERLIVVAKPEQSGKTFLMIETIKNCLNEEISNPNLRTINIVCCDNSLLLTKQTGARIASELTLIDTGCGEEVYLTLSSTSSCNNVDSAIGVIYKSEPEINNILCCTNNIRISNIITIISAFSREDGSKYNFRIWLDESDKYDDYITDILIPCLKKYKNVQLYLMSATTPPQWFHEDMLGPEINFFPIENTTHEFYHGWEDNIIRVYDDASDPLTFFANRLGECKTESLIKPGELWFIPALTKKKSHEYVAKICSSHGMATMIINGDGVAIRLPSDEQLGPFPKDRPLNELLRDYYVKYDLVRFAVCITGNICVGRGVTIWSNDFRPSYGIMTDRISHNKRELSQTAGRMKGSFKSWPDFANPVIFTTPQFNDNAITWERRNRRLGKIAYDKELNNHKPTLSKFEYKTAGRDTQRIVKLFKTFEEAKSEFPRVREPKKDPTGKYICGVKKLLQKTMLQLLDLTEKTATMECNPTLQRVIADDTGNKSNHRLIPLDKIYDHEGTRGYIAIISKKTHI